MGAYHTPTNVARFHFREPCPLRKDPVVGIFIGDVVVVNVETFAIAVVDSSTASGR